MNTKQIPIAPGLFTVPGSSNEEPSLLAGKCENCSEIIFPSQPSCPNCGNKRFSNIKLGRTGRIVKSTIVRHPPQLYKGPVPYAVCEVEMPDGVNVPTIVKGWEKDEPPPYGLEVEMYLEKLEVDEEGNDVLMYVFKPTQN